MFEFMCCMYKRGPNWGCQAYIVCSILYTGDWLVENYKTYFIWEHFLPCLLKNLACSRTCLLKNLEGKVCPGLFFGGISWAMSRPWRPYLNSGMVILHSFSSLYQLLLETHFGLKNIYDIGLVDFFMAATLTINMKFYSGLTPHSCRPPKTAIGNQ